MGPIWVPRVPPGDASNATAALGSGAMPRRRETKTADALARELRVEIARQEAELRVLRVVLASLNGESPPKRAPRFQREGAPGQSPTASTTATTPL